MKTITMRDIITKVAQPGQIESLCEELTHPQYFSLMADVGTECEDPQSIGVLRPENKESKTFIKALVKCFDKPKKFWENANALILSVNEGIDNDDRLRFHLEDRIIEDELITLLDKGVPSNADALKHVVEIPDGDKTILDKILSGAINRFTTATGTLRLSNGMHKACVGLFATETSYRFMEADTMTAVLLRVFKNSGQKKVTLRKAFLESYIDPNHYWGNLESELARTSVIVSLLKDDGTSDTLVINIFSNLVAKRMKGGNEISNELPDELEITMNDEVWYILTSQFTEK